MACVMDKVSMKLRTSQLFTMASGEMDNGTVRERSLSSPGKDEMGKYTTTLFLQSLKALPFLLSVPTTKVSSKTA